MGLVDYQFKEKGPSPTKFKQIFWKPFLLVLNLQKETYVILFFKEVWNQSIDKSNGVTDLRKWAFFLEIVLFFEEDTVLSIIGQENVVWIERFE